MRNYLVALVTLKVLCLAARTALADDPEFDVGVEATVVSDYMDVGLTNSDHRPSASFKVSPSYDIFYGSLSWTSIDYGVPDPKAELKAAIGATPEFGNLAIDFNLQRRVKIDDPTSDRWLPYVTATYTFNDSLNMSLGSGYYMFDDVATPDYWELYGGFTLTHGTGTTFTGEAYWEPDSDGFDNAYYAVYGTLTVPFAEKWEAIGKVGYEGYEDVASTAPYMWYEARLNYNVNPHITVGVAYHGNDLSSSECATQAYTDCSNALFASLTLKGNLSDLKK